MNKIGTRNQFAREKWLESTLRQVPAGSRILDAGAGERQYERFCSHLNYVSQDFAQYDGKGNGSGLQMGAWDQTKLDIVSDITAIPEPEGSFDAIMCVEVFEHLPDPLKAIKEFSRLLKPNGYLILTAPFCSLTHFAPYHYYSGFNRYFYESHLSAYGFEIIEIERNGNYFEYLSQEIRRTPSLMGEYCSFNPLMIKVLWRLIMFPVLAILGFLSKRDKGSEELLCYGYHILARKV